MAARKNEAFWYEPMKHWRIKVQADGERRDFYSSTPGKKGKAEAEKKADKWLELRLTDSETKVSAMLTNWIESVKARTSDSNYRQYNGYIERYIKPVIGMKRIGHINKNDLQAVIDKAYQSKNLAYKTLKNIRACLMSFMAYCRDGNATMLHPGKLKIPAGATKQNKKIVVPEDLKILFSSDNTAFRGKTEPDFHIHAYRFAVLTGVRPGELLGLQFKNIKGNKVTITQAINDDGQITQGKNDNARRTYELSKRALKEIDAQKALLYERGLVPVYVFPRETGEPLTQRLFRLRWERYCTANNFKQHVSPYELRHTFVSVNDEMPEGLKKMVVGHSRNMDTEGTYGHVKQGDMERAAEYIERAFDRYLEDDKN